MDIDASAGGGIFPIVMPSLVCAMAAVALFEQRVASFHVNLLDQKPR